MQSDTQAAPISKAALWTGRILSTLSVLLLLMSGVMKLMKPPGVLQGFAKLGYSEHLLVGIGLVEIACTVIYMIPRTSVLGAILLTGYLGGATASTLRVDDPSFLAPALFGVVLWLGLFLRDVRLRGLIPLRR